MDHRPAEAVARAQAATPHGGTAMYDAVSEAIPLVQQGQFRKKALVVISDGNDTSSTTRLRDVQQQIRESEALVYAVGIDCSSSGPTAAERQLFRAAEAADSAPVSVSRPGRPRWMAARRSRRTSLVGGRRRAPIP
jgi:hypothetical protein